MADAFLEMNLFGPCVIRAANADGFSISGAKQRALLALLATAPFGRRSRAFLQETLWGDACYDTGRQSLRRALADIKQVMGDVYGQVISGGYLDLAIDLGKVRFTGSIQSGLFLEGLEIKEKGFLAWRNAIRQNPDQFAGLFTPAGDLAQQRVLPAVAVLPFRAIGGDETDAVLGDWLAEEICRSLTRSRLLAVISHLSCRSLARGPVDVAAVKTSLRADFCVTGTLRRLGDEVILDADFIDTRSGRILWTRQFAGTAQSFIDQSSEGVALIASAIRGAIAEEALAHVRGLPLAAIEDHRLLVAGVSLMHRATLREFARARELIEETVRRAPLAPEGHAWLGNWYVLSVFNGWASDARAETAKALDCTTRSLDLSPDNAFCLTIDGFAQNNLMRRLDVAEERYKAALEVNPSSALSWLLKGAMHAFRDEGNEAIRATGLAKRLSPLDPFGYFYDSLSATAHLSAGKFDQALELADVSLKANDRHLSTFRTKIVALHSLGRGDEARLVARDLMRRQPDFTVDAYLRSHPAADFKFGRNAAAALLAAGVPE